LKRALLVFALASWIAGCTGASPAPVVHVDSSGAQGSGPRVVVAPLNLPVAAPEEVSDAVPVVERELIEQLRRRGARVAVIYARDAEALWAAAAAAVPPSGDSAADLRTAAGKFAGALATAEPYDLLLLPSLALREARVSGRIASWDGVKRRIPVRTTGVAEDTHTAPDAPVFDTAEGMVASSQWGGRIAGLSLHLLAYRPGRKPMERWAGLDVVHETVQVRDTTTGAQSDVELRPRPRLFADTAVLDESIAQGLDPIWSRVR
jgi:hypothetical protein